jgi:molecular chaperone DnaK
MTLLNQGLQKIGESPDVDELLPIVGSLIDLLPVDERPSGDNSILVG